MDDDDPFIPGLDPRKRPQTVFKTQLILSIFLGLTTFLIFCNLRSRWPQLYAVRTLRRNDIKPLPKNLFGWIKILYQIQDEDILAYAGLDAFVFLGFFKMAIKIFTTFSVLAICIISPIRLYYTGNYDRDDITWSTTGDGDDNQPHKPEDPDDPDDPDDPNNFSPYLWMYAVFSYIFTILVYYFLFDQTKKVVTIRQKYLGSQNSITDKTILINGIPKNLVNNKNLLKNHIEKLGIGKVNNISIVYNWNELKRLFDERNQLIRTLEVYYSKYLGLNISVYKYKNPSVTPKFYPDVISKLQLHSASQISINETNDSDHDNDHDHAINNNNSNSIANGDINNKRKKNPIKIKNKTKTNDLENQFLSPSQHPNNFQELNSSSSSIIYFNSTHNKNNIPNTTNITSLGNDSDALIIQTDDDNNHKKINDVNNLRKRNMKRPTIRLGFLGLFGKKVDAINYYAIQLKKIDSEIIKMRTNLDDFKPTNSAFITMDTVASAQMAAQAVLDPKVGQLIAKLAPSPNDIIWENFSKTYLRRIIQDYSITFIMVITSFTLVFPVSSIAALLNLKTITKFWPLLGHLIEKSKWATTIVTGILPPALFTLLNVLVPYFYLYLSTKQGFISNTKIELSSVSKNFYYIFFNLFFVFTFAGVASNYWSLLSDTTKIAYLLANSVKSLSLFYVDLILLQGIGMFPFKLLQIGDVFLMSISKLFYCKTPRDYRSIYYIPSVFDFGLILPQPILIFIIIVIYSIFSTKIVTAGLAYFILGFYVYKYQLMYSMVHPQHSTGQAWSMIFRRICIGLVIFELTMAGTLALENAYILAALQIPLIASTLMAYYRFEKDYFPLSNYIALRAIKSRPDNNNFDGVDENNNNYSSATSTPVNTISSRYYDNPNIHHTDSEQSLSTSDLTNFVQNSLHKKKSTLDEERDEFQQYNYPYLTDKLEGPWIGFDKDLIYVVDYKDSEFDNNDINVLDNVDHIDDHYMGETILKVKHQVAEWN
ncbi:DUF221-domain-containing protein [Ascoidea rubescens DSM 1968]|uniref:DUF221-domain-containing protein n=1 Tax=Ascoidea rubescens DSM 1968 TaxID=1344418 RepID=A0A1D2VQ09_9ASCO|nr:DUF221-domain-containing protein [Ascoidea rubescens DSM 1968]ODV63688.1 DUF221-domain-containing protein [Ascoidea rubescens DSM 1968]